MKKYLLSIVLALILTIPISAESAKPESFPSIVLTGNTIDLTKAGSFDNCYINEKPVTDSKYTAEKQGILKIKIVKDGKKKIHEIRVINGWLTVAPPLVAIILALILKNVVISLFAGIFTGGLIVTGFNPISAFFRVVDKYAVEAAADPERAAIIIFTLFLGGMVGIINKSGGIKGVVNTLAERVSSPRGIQLYTWLMGLVIFFDDYTNTLIVGNTMRSLSDKWKISREKLAYIVDSTAAPMASIAIISTWIGFEVSLINQALKSAGIASDAYSIFLQSLPYRFYPLITLLFVFLIFTLNRDFGPMLKAERRARKGKVMSSRAVPLSDFDSDGLSPAPETKARWYNGLLPIVTVILFTFCGLYYSGITSLQEQGSILGNKSLFDILTEPETVRNLGTIISSADSFKVLLWGSLMGVTVAVLLPLTQKLLKLNTIVEAFISGMKAMMMAMVILILAWSLGVQLTELHTAKYLVSLLSEGTNPALMPAIVFILSALVAFSTGSSWGTIAIMYPLVIPIVIKLTEGSDSMERILILSISSVLTGAVLGDHCSPISDTTIMSSTASSCDHIDHVKTQMPYALSAGMITIFLGIIPVSMGVAYPISVLLAVTATFCLIRFVGKEVK